jgi:hypothetical protein
MLRLETPTEARQHPSDLVSPTKDLGHLRAEVAQAACDLQLCLELR